MQIYITIFLVLLVFGILYKGGFLGTAAAALPKGFAFQHGTNPSDLLDDNKEKFSLENNPIAGGTTSTAQIASGAALTTVKPSELLPSDPHAGFASLSGGGLIEGMVPAEINDPSRNPNYTSTSKSKIPNWQLRADPLVDRSVVAGQFFNLTPDTHPDMYKNRGVEITRKMVTE